MDIDTHFKRCYTCITLQYEIGLKYVQYDLRSNDAVDQMNVLIALKMCV